MKLYNSLTKQKENFGSLNKTKVTLYVCGITPYDTTHLGHAFTYISFDALIRYLKFQGFDVIYTQNVTDINDRDNDILKRSHEQNISWEKLSDFWTKKFLEDMTTLNWTMPSNYLKASEQIPPMISLIEKITQNGFAYVVNGSVYFDISKDKGFGKLSGFDKEKMLSVSEDFEEDLENPDKKNPLDITLWRATAPNQPKHIPSFDSPWGQGRPGWHVECSAMAISSLGEQIDIHGGGKDLIYPHHESEIAQSEGGTGRVPFVKYWMHTGTVYYQGEKMSKSKGNLVMVSDLLKKYSANAIRWLLLSHHYREDWEFREEELEEAEKTLSVILTPPSAGEESPNLFGTLAFARDPSLESPPDSLLLRITLGDDLDTPKALEIIRDTKDLAALKLLGFSF